MTALLCLLMGGAALALAVVLPGQRLYLGLLAVVAGAAAALLSPARARPADGEVAAPAPDPRDPAPPDPDPRDPGPPDFGSWERTAPS